MGQVVPIPGAEKPAKIRSVFAPALLPFVTFVIYLFFWWYSSTARCPTTARRGAATSLAIARANRYLRSRSGR